MMAGYSMLEYHMVGFHVCLFSFLMILLSMDKAMDGLCYVETRLMYEYLSDGWMIYRETFTTCVVFLSCLLSYVA
ncbi:hypothetical protein V8F20_012121 [Naviculisporaceae sp. PSN 640]